MDMVASNVTIKVDGVEKTKTDKTGRYYLSFDRIPGKYLIEPDNPDYFFEPVTVYVDENTEELPPITATTVYICGTVWLIKDLKYV